MNTLTLRNHGTTTIATALIFWVAAALLIVMVHGFFEPISPAASVVVKILVILTISFAYMRLSRREVTIEEALFVGVGWAVLAMITEVAASTRLGRGWFDLIGSPAHDALRIVLLFAWIAAPALFARRHA
jgi:uncharacterized membrane protein YfcA